MLDRRVLANLIEIHDLPTLPQVLNEILRAANDDRSSARDLRELLERDHAIAARVLRLANSAFYGVRHPVESIQQAVVVLGFEAVTELALATSVFSTFSERRQFALDPGDFWMHSFGTAKAAQLLCVSSGCDVEQESCFTAGLLQGIGKYVLALVLKGEYGRLVERARSEQRRLVDVERPLLGMTHDTIGAWLAEKWRFPELTQEVIATQYKAPEDLAAVSRAASLVVLAKGIARESGFGNAGDYDLRGVDTRIAAALGVDRGAIEGAQEELHGVYEEVRTFVMEQGTGGSAE